MCDTWVAHARRTGRERETARGGGGGRERACSRPARVFDLGHVLGMSLAQPLQRADAVVPQQDMPCPHHKMHIILIILYIVLYIILRYVKHTAA